MVEDDGKGAVEHGLGGGTTVAIETAGAGAGDGRYRPGKVHLADAMVSGIGYVEVADAIDSEVPWLVEKSLGGGPTIADTGIRTKVSSC